MAARSNSRTVPALQDFAAAEAAQRDITRRNIFGAALGLTAAAAAAPAIADEPSEIRRLYDNWLALRAAYDAADAAAERAWEATLEVEVPEVLNVGDGAQRGLGSDFVAGLPMLPQGQKTYSLAQRERVAEMWERNRRTFEQSGMNRKAALRCKEVLDGLDELKRRRQAREVDVGLFALYDRAEEASKALHVAEEALVDATPVTLADARLKARFVLRHMEKPEEGTLAAWTYGFVADLAEQA